MSPPFFTIGVTTYNRHELLRDSLNSIIAQSFTDFEVIVGNDFTTEDLSREMLGITDSRIHIINHSCNLREVGNMNALLSMASGRYFTWLFDDDLFQPNFLLTAHEHIVKNGYPPALFPSYSIYNGQETPLFEEISNGKVQLFTGREFLDKYFAGRLKMISTSGLFELSMLKSIVGGVEELCVSGVGLYCEYLFLVRCALFDRIAYIDSPFILYRAHAGSWSMTNTELDKYLAAGKELVKRSGDVLRHRTLSDDFDKNLVSLCKIHLTSFAGKSAVHVIIGRKYSIGVVCRAFLIFFEEAENVRQEFINVGGSMSIASLIGFVSIHLRSCYIISCMIGFNWCKKMIGRNT